MTRKQRKTALIALKEWAIENNVTDKAELRERFDLCIEEPDPVIAVERVKNEKFNRFIASIRDKSGSRMAFPVKGKDGNTRIHIIPGTPDLEATVRVEERLTHNSSGNDRTRGPVSLWKAELAGQLSLGLEEME